jgi:hypothetical protein
MLVICAVLAAGTAGAPEPAAPSRAQLYRRVLHGLAVRRQAGSKDLPIPRARHNAAATVMHDE